MKKTPVSMMDESTRKIILAGAEGDAKRFVLEHHPNFLETKEEIERLADQIIELNLQKVEPDSEQMYRDVYKRKFVARYLEVVSWLQKP